MRKNYIINVLLAFYSVALGFFSGFLIGNLLPFAWPYSTIFGYALGLFIGIFVSFELLKKWQRSALTKAIAAIILLLMVASISMQLNLMSLQLTKMNLSLMYP